MNFQNNQALDQQIFYGKPEQKNGQNISEIINLDYESFIYDTTQGQLKKSKLQIEIIRDKEIKYFIDGENIRKDQVHSSSFGPEVLTNLVQIKYLKWQANHPMNSKKHFKWTARWKDGKMNYWKLEDFIVKIFFNNLKSQYTTRMDKSQEFGIGLNQQSKQYSPNL